MGEILRALSSWFRMVGVMGRRQRLDCGILVQLILCSPRRARCNWWLPAVGSGQPCLRWSAATAAMYSLIVRHCSVEERWAAKYATVSGDAGNG